MASTPCSSSVLTGRRNALIFSSLLMFGLSSAFRRMPVLLSYIFRSTGYGMPSLPPYAKVYLTGSFQCSSVPCTTCDGAHFGGAETKKCMWSGITWSAIGVQPCHAQILRIVSFTTPSNGFVSTFILVFGIQMRW